MRRSDRYHVGLLLLGVSVGILLGPSVLGRYAGPTHMGTFTRDPALDGFDEQLRKRRGRLADTGATEAAILEFDRHSQLQRQGLELQAMRAHQQILDRWLGLTMAVVCAIAFMMAGEVMIKRKALGNRLATARYALMAVWIAMVFIGPAWHLIPVTFTLLLLVVALATALVPLSSAVRSGASPKR